MSLKPTKFSNLQLSALVKELSASKRKRLPGIPPEDLMEMAADHLEDPWARSFFTTIAGFTRLAQLLTESTKNITPWLEKRFPEAKEDERLRGAIEMISKQSLEHINLNITLKRITAILTQGERAVMAEGLMDLLSPEGNIAPEKMTALESTLTRVLLSEEAATDLIENWKRKRKPEWLPE